MKINVKSLLISILIPVGLGFIVGLLTGVDSNYTTLNQPSFAPPSYLFPIVWTILYILMGISSYLVKDDDKALKIYYISLGINLLWSFFFFTFKWYLFSFVWIILLIVSVILMIREFYRVNKVSSYLQIPYLLWLIFASVLNFFIFILN